MSVNTMIAGVLSANTCPNDQVRIARMSNLRYSVQCTNFDQMMNPEVA